MISFETLRNEFGQSFRQIRKADGRSCFGLLFPSRRATKVNLIVALCNE
jgi:hypothetical protein